MFVACVGWWVIDIARGLLLLIVLLLGGSFIDLLVSCLFVKLVGAFWCFECCVAFAVLFVPCLSYLWISVC